MRPYAARPAALAARCRRKLAAARALSPVARAAAVRAALWLVVVRAALRLVGYARTRALIERGLRTPLADADSARALDIARGVDVAARNAAPPARCLPRALVLYRLARADGLPAAIHIGVARPDAARLDAHAWVSVGGVVVGEPPDLAARFDELRPGAAHVAAARARIS